MFLSTRAPPEPQIRFPAPDIFIRYFENENGVINLRYFGYFLPVSTTPGEKLCRQRYLRVSMMSLEPP
jgi:hypothetical protein